jgi:hypothetical protein
MAAFWGSLVLAVLSGTPVLAESLGAEIQRIEKTLEGPGLSGAGRRDALTRLARLQELSGDMETAARRWGEAAAAEPGTPDDLSLIRGAWCLAAMGEWERAGAAVKAVLLAGRPGPALLKARYLGALIEALESANFSALRSLAGSPGLETIRPPVYYALWRLLGPAGEGVPWKNRLLAEFPRSPEGRIAAAEDGADGIEAATSPLWLLFPGRAAVTLSESPGMSRIEPAAPVPAAPPPAPSSADRVLLQTGLFGSEANAEKQADQLRGAGFFPLITRRTVRDAEYWAVGIAPGQNTNQMIRRLKDAGFESFPVSLN